MSDIDGLATYPELPATGTRDRRRHQHRVGELHDGDVEAPESRVAHPDGNGEHRRRRAAGGQCAARGHVQVRGRMAGDAQPEGHVSESACGHARERRGSIHCALRLRRPGTGHGGRVYALAREAQPDPRKDGHARGHAAQARAEESARVLQGAAHARGLSRFAHGRVSVLSLRLRHPGAGRRRGRADDSGARARPQAASRVSRGLRPAPRVRSRGTHRQP